MKLHTVVSHGLPCVSSRILETIVHLPLLLLIVEVNENISILSAAKR